MLKMFRARATRTPEYADWPPGARSRRGERGVPDRIGRTESGDRHDEVRGWRRCRRHHVARVVSCMVCVTAIAAPTALAADGDAQLLAAAQHQGASGQLDIKAHFKQTLALTGKTLDVAKVVDAQGRAYLVATDEQGDVVDYDAATARESAAVKGASGKLDPKLAQRVATLKADETTPVSVWLKLPADFSPSRGEGQAPAQALAAAQRAIAPSRTSVTDALKRMRAADVSTPQYAPAVFARLTPGQIKKLEQRPEVDTIYGQASYTNFQDDSATTERANSIWAAGNLGFGTSSRPAIHEPDAVSDGNPSLSSAIHPVLYYCGAVNALCPSGKNIGSGGGHASRVAGAIGSTNPLLRGIAPNAQMLISENSQTFNDSDLVAANEWGRGNGADPTNMSWGSTCPDGQQNFMSRYVDFAVANFFQTFTISSGNTRGCSARDLQVSAPGVAFGAITVGAMRDGNDGFWNNDAMSAFSRFQNPDFAPDEIKPEVVAVGEDQCLSNDSTSDCGNAGTSFSAPQVAGQVASMLARRPGQNVWPETNKAAVLTSAYHPIGTADQSGLGAVVMNNSDDTYRLGRFINECGASCGRLGTGDFDASGNRNHPVNLIAGQRVKVAISWDANSNPGGGTDVIGADIDLSVLDPSGAPQCGSFSVNNTWESCEFTAPTTGTYTFREHLFSSQAGWPGTFMGMAWSVRSLPNPCSAPLKAFLATGGTVSFSTANGPTYFDAYSGWGFDQSGREQVIRYVNTTTKNLTFAESAGSDPAGNLDLHVVQIPSCTANPVVPTVLAHGTNSVSLASAPPGTYYLIVDGRNGAVGTDAVNLSFP